MMGYRLVDRAFVWANRPHDDMLLAESEKQVKPRVLALQIDGTIPSAPMQLAQLAMRYDQ